VARNEGFGDEVERARAAPSLEAAAERVSDEFIDLVAVAGTPETVAEREAAMREAGIDLPLYGIDPILDDDELRESTIEAIS